MPKPDVSEERKNQIIAAATAVFAEKGFYEARMDDIVTASGLSKGTLYWYFDSKDAIITAILDQFFNQEMAEIALLLTADMPVAQKLELMVKQVTADMQQMNIYRSIALEFYALAGRREDVRLSLLRYFRDFQVELARLFQQGIESGEFRAVDPMEVAGVFIAQMEGVALLWAFNPDEFHLEKSIETAVDLFINGLTPHPP